MPDLAKVEIIQRDLSKTAAKVKKARENYLKQLEQIGVSEDEIDQFLEASTNGKKRI
jgi:superfamily I DNA and RNA helicase